MKRQCLLSSSCAQHALQAAFEVLGERFSLARLHYVTRSLFGTDTPNVEKGIQRLGYKTWTYNYGDTEKAKRALHNQIAAGNPCIVAVNDSNHWIAVLGFDAKGNFVCFDSSNKHNLVRCWTWSALHQWMVSDLTIDSYFFIAIRRNNEGVVKQMRELYPVLRANPRTWFKHIDLTNSGER